MSTVYGVATNDADYQVRHCRWENGKSVQEWICPFYKTWIQMLVRSYGKHNKEKYPVFVCEEWLTFSNFKSWMEQQDWEGKDLDKDLLGGESKYYSPFTCCFISPSINKFFNLQRNKNRDLPVGVSHQHKRGKPYVARITIDGKGKHLGQFDSKEEAHFAWLTAKIEDLTSKLYQNNLDVTCALFKINQRLKLHLVSSMILTSYWR